MADSTIEILFDIPVRIKEGVELKKFSNKTNEIQYLLISDKRHYLVNLTIYNLIEVIKKFSGITEIRKEYSKTQNSEYSTNDIIIAINEILVQKHVVESKYPIKSDRPKSFLYFKFPIFSRSALKPITGVLQNLFKPKIAYLLIAITIFAHMFIALNYFNQGQLTTLLANPYSMLITMSLLLFSIIFHEFGHSSACRFFGARYEEIGFGIYLRFPVFYSNISDVWRLPPYKRAIIDIAGMYFQYLFNIILIIVFLITKQEIFLNVVKLVCIQTLFTLNPFFRFDGYWVATDLLGVPNLRKKSSEMLFYLAQKYLLGKNPKQIILHIKPFAKKIFVFYAVISNVFFVYFIFFFFVTIPSIIMSLPTAIQNTVNVVLNNDQYSIQEIVTSVYQLLIRLLLTGFSLFFTVKIISRINKLLIKIYNTLIIKG